MVRPVRLAPPHRFTRDDYHAMAEAGILGEDDRVELIAGEIITQMPIGTVHAGTVKRLNQLFTDLARGRCIVSVQDPIALDPFSEPQPDIALLRPRLDFYASAHPEPGDVLLIVEVADTTLAFDREEKIPLYAGAGIPEVWLVDLADKSLSVFRLPVQGSYTEVTRHRSGATIGVPGLPDASLAVGDLSL
ncbi:MAG: Uma2 family endonuclease [Verrucomicrobia bacterium]|nr:Uma2 family endonuclease [Verrucomicrobiota bacterium]